MQDGGQAEGGAARTGSGSSARRWRLLGVVVLVVALLAGASAAWSQLAHQGHSEHHTFWQSIKTVEVDSGSAQVLIEAGAPDRVTVKESLDWSLRRPSVTAEADGNTLRVSVSCRGPIAVIGCGAALDIQVPAATEIRTQSSSGSTLIRGISGEIRSRTSSGLLQLEYVSGQVWAKASSGQIIAKELGSSVVQAAASSGEVSLAFARPPTSVTATTTSGPVSIAVPVESTRYQVSGHRLSGSWSVDPDVSDSSSGRTIDITTMSGAVAVTSTPAGAGSGPAPTTPSAPTTSVSTALPVPPTPGALTPSSPAHSSSQEQSSAPGRLRPPG
ncbi:DUF4097 family beta strand repeat-containing protein [Kitasatospora sp. GP82]|uniref:DUF4097 family beta strand repeat-containing protein n=1 Tax=Kitasatospora sp. GP82 TaxID=3035089 RepID=UPI0024736B29|nr:DUF4097 family beta strand repeat-containing protein [Kitasatospora sp. GP82]MDH6125269.1 hypothetical protein [Kitasatospora sp. GP82]